MSFSLVLQEGLPTLQTLDEMQCMWFQTELAHAYQRVGQLGEALVKYHEIDRVSCTLAMAGLCMDGVCSSYRNF